MATENQGGTASSIEEVLEQTGGDRSMPKGPVDPAYKEQTQGLREITEVLNAGLDQHTEKQSPSRFDQDALDRVAVTRAREFERAAQNLQNKAPTAPEALTNNISSDEVFTASETTTKLSIPSEISKRFSQVGDRFYHHDSQDLAFIDRTNKLETKSDNDQVAESLVMIAQSRGWDEIKVAGSETFRKEVWIEATRRGMTVKGYTPSEQDKAEVAKRAPVKEAVEEKGAAFRGREKEIDVVRAFKNDTPAKAVEDHPKLAGAYGAMAAINKQAQADGMTPEQQAVYMARVKQNVTNSIERGHTPDIKVVETQKPERSADDERDMSR